ncbi:MAG: hypothetical protein AAGB13_02500 [Cyanobacteria bacterium P01_F01_bin.33]
MSTRRVSLTLDESVVEFVDAQTDNRSHFINQILWNEKRRRFLEELGNAYEEQANDREFQRENELWNTTVSDGLDA